MARKRSRIARQLTAALVLAATSLLPCAAVGQNYRSVTTRDGLSSMFVLRLYQDAQGRLWAGTVNGVSVLGGNNAAVIYADRPELQSLAGTMVTGITGSPDGSLWFGTARWDEQTSTLERHPEIPGQKLLAINPQGEAVAFASTGQLFYLERQRRRFRPLESAKVPSFDGFAECQQAFFLDEQRMCILTRDSLWCYTFDFTAAAAPRLTHQSRSALSTGRLLGAFRDGDSLLLVGEDHRVHLANLRTPNPAPPLPTPNSPPSTSSMTIARCSSCWPTSSGRISTSPPLPTWPPCNGRWPNSAPTSSWPRRPCSPRAAWSSAAR